MMEPRRANLFTDWKRFLKRFLLIGISLLGIAMSMGGPCHAGGKVAPNTSHAHRSATKTYQGAWFTIRYPGMFHVRSGQKSPTSTTGYDSAFFVSPHDTVEFYVFSPQWSGKPEYVHIDPRRETIVSQRRQHITKGDLSRQATWVTVRAKDNSYTRSWVDTQTEDTRLVFGIFSRNAKDLVKYRRQYLAFKTSLQQFAD